jgi:hypothetical protein
MSRGPNTKRTIHITHNGSTRADGEAYTPTIGSPVVGARERERLQPLATEAMRRLHEPRVPEVHLDMDGASLHQQVIEHYEHTMESIRDAGLI